MSQNNSNLFRWKDLVLGWGRFVFGEGDARGCAVIRILFAALLLPYLFLYGLDLEMFFGESGVLPYGVSKSILETDYFSFLGWLAPNAFTLKLCFAVFFLNVILLLFGVFSRFQAAAVFFWLISFHHRNDLILDGEDTVARWIAFCLICMPCGEHFSFDAYRKKLKGGLQEARSLWGLRLLQIEMTLIYASTVLLKMDSEDWLSGHVLVYVSQLHDLFGRFPLPDFIMHSASTLIAMAHVVLAIEVLIPILLWFKGSRRLAIILGLGLHLSLEYSMNLFLFQWLMILGLSSFVDWPGILDFFGKKKSSSKEIAES